MASNTLISGFYKLARGDAAVQDTEVALMSEHVTSQHIKYFAVEGWIYFETVEQHHAFWATVFGLNLDYHTAVIDRPISKI